jgi:catechol 2,3-dioxygenase-like lactoylglutathione lyase family enzyme
MIRNLDHYNIRTFDIDGTVRFYIDVLGLHVGPFMQPTATGAWLYDQTERPIVHLIGIDRDDPEIAIGRIRERLSGLGTPVDPETFHGSGAIDHVAFECEDYEGMKADFQARGMKYTENDVPSIKLRQLFVNDPNGVTLELNFRY